MKRLDIQYNEMERKIYMIPPLNTPPGYKMIP